MKLGKKLHSSRAIVLGILLFLFGVVVVPAAQADNVVTEQTDVYHYRMKGKVRLLLFWIGKDDVGGGTITFSRAAGNSDGVREESIEVLFGSKPERVPGKVNRWGYGRETAYWEKMDGGRGPVLVKSVFEGFMRHSDEESLSEVQEKNRNEQAEELYWYDATRSTVLPGRADSEIRYFSTQEDFDYRNPKAILCGYVDRLKNGAADKKKELSNPEREKRYKQPLGFLTAIRTFTDQVLETYRKEKKWTRDDPVVNYVYNSKLYQLKLKNVKHHDSFGLPLAEEVNGEKEKKFRNVIQEDFELKNLATGDTHDFSIWVPLEGEHRGIPIRIEDKPRWWLRIELNLELDPTRRDALQPVSFDHVECGGQAS